jgi:hypothetical protein
LEEAEEGLADSLAVHIQACPLRGAVVTGL